MSTVQPVGASEANSASVEPSKKAQWIKSFDLNKFERGHKLWSKEATSEYRAVRAMQKAAFVVAAIVVFAFEAIQNGLKYVANLGISGLNKAHNRLAKKEIERVDVAPVVSESEEAALVSSEEEVSLPALPGKPKRFGSGVVEAFKTASSVAKTAALAIFVKSPLAVFNGVKGFVSAAHNQVHPEVTTPETQAS